MSTPAAASGFDVEFEGFGGDSVEVETDADDLQADGEVVNDNTEAEAAGFWTVAEGSGVTVDDDEIEFSGFQATGADFGIETEGVEIDGGEIDTDDLFQTDGGRLDIAMAGGGSIETDTFEIDADGSVETDTFEIDSSGFETEDVEVDADGSIDVRNGAELETNDVDIKDGDVEITSGGSVDIEIDSDGNVEIN